MNFKPKINISIEISPGETKRAGFVLDEWIVKEAFKPLDFPSPDAAGLEKVFCTPHAEIVKVTKTRQEIAELISKQLIDQIIDLMGIQDTEMGYPKLDR